MHAFLPGQCARALICDQFIEVAAGVLIGLQGECVVFCRRVDPGDCQLWPGGDRRVLTGRQTRDQGQHQQRDCSVHLHLINIV